MKNQVALETTVMTHGLPLPTNFQAMRDMMSAIRELGPEPAPIAIIRGKPVVNVPEAELERLALASDVRKCSLRDLPIVGNTLEDGGTTVSATLFLALRAGIQVFATGGIGGVHRGDDGDVSADLPALATLPGTVVCSGAKSILDLPKTVERLESDGVTVLGYQTDEFPAFTCRESGLPVDHRVDSPEAVAEIIHTRDAIGLRSSILVCVPCPPKSALTPSELESGLELSLENAERQKITGKALTPFLLDDLARQTRGKSLAANLALLINNARIAAEIQTAFFKGSVPS
ncbi:MAG: pseudouridine-5'-phosphate glycosidase [Verrucomicrobia bacterium]|nr:pseudouridine-5'-phosphate glycosidase [Verrucomicrobiota bacterium]MCH8512874.1 pseudouridine-5'-phosphate glycosidase [Kiritimatiellia bacterium]